MKRGLAVLLIVLMVILLCPNTGHTDEGEAYPFSVEPILPSANIGDAGYHITADPGETVSLQAVLSNLTGHTINLYLTAINAYSGPEGIFYQSPDQVDSQTAALADERADFAQYISMEDTVMLIAGMSAILTVQVTVPEMNAGVLLGGFRVTVDGQSIDTAMEIDLPSEAAPSVAAGDITITDQGLSIPIVNQSVAIARSVSAAYEIRDKQRSVILEGNIALPEMAPLTEYYILHPAEPQVWANGPYTLNIQIDTDGQETDFVQTFAVGEANRIEYIVPQGIKPAESAADRQGKEAIPSGEGQQEAVLPTAAADQQEAGSAAVSPLAEKDTESDGGISRGVVSCVVFGIPAIFAGIILWMGANRKRGKHERPPWWRTGKHPSWYRTGKHAQPSWWRAGKHSPAAEIS